jgi:hydroxybutyrate-dimer hydrolase
VGLPVYASTYVPLMPYAWAAMDAAWAHVTTGAALPADVIVQTRPRAAGEVLSGTNLGNLSVLSAGATSN